MNALLFERPVWFATGPLVLEEEAQEMEDVTYHRPVLVAEVVELLAPRPGTLVVDATCGGGGHSVDLEAGEIAVPLRIRSGDTELAFISTATTFGTAVDVTVSELSIESFFPADDATARALQAQRLSD